MASIFDKQILSDADYKRIQELGDEWMLAKDQNTRNQIHQKAEAIRQSYGYSGGADGSQFLMQNQNVLNTATSANDYTDAVKEAKQLEQEQMEQRLKDVESSAAARLKEAYIKNMQDNLLIDQNLKKSGITGGASESVRAYMANMYNSNRNEIMSDTQAQKENIQNETAKILSDYTTDIAKAGYDSALKRADALKEAEQTAYDRQLDAYDREYQKAKDERDFEYKKQTDASKKSSSSGTKLTASNVISLMKSGVYDPSFAVILGISDSEVKSIANSSQKDAAWKLLNNGIYDDSFPEILGYSADILKNYANSVLNGF